PGSRAQRPHRRMGGHSYPSSQLFPLAIKFAPDIRVKGPKIKPQCVIGAPTSPADQLAHHFCSVIDHRDHPGIIEPGGSDHADHADDPAGIVTVGGDDGGGARQREQIVLRADEDAGAIGVFGAAQQIDLHATRADVQSWWSPAWASSPRWAPARPTTGPGSPPANP